jgi:multidrug efflux pump subunit AcrB
MNITRFAIEKKRITGTALAVVFLSGIAAYRTMSRAEDPGFIIRTALIQTIFPGASPERVELLVTDKLEKSIQEMPELDFISSESKTGVSVIYVNIQESYRDMRPIWDDLRRKVEDARAELPEDVIGPFVNDEFGDVFGVVATLTGEGYTYAELKEIADDVRDEFLLIAEVAKVELFGTQEERIFVEYDNARLAEVGLSPFQLIQLMESRNIIIPGGELTTEDEKIALEPSGNFETVDDLRRSVITVPGSPDVLYLEDIATVTRGYIDPPESKVTATGEPAIALAISMREGGNILTLGEQVEQTLDRLQALYPYGLELEFVAFQPREVEHKIQDFQGNLIQAVVVVTAVMLLFLGLRTGLVVATLVPGAIVSAFFVMGVFGIGLDQVSIASLIIALGMLVDNAIVMSESIMVQIGEGKQPVEAAVDSAKELRGPLLIASLTTAAAFLPIFLAESSTGEYTAPLFKVVTITLLCSWVLALTMIPLLCVRFIRVKQKQAGADRAFDSPFYRSYRGLLTRMLRNRVATVGGIVVVFFVSMMGFRFVPALFFPPTDKAFFKAELELPIGTPIERTERMVREVERFMLDSLPASEETPGVVSWASFMGNGGPRFLLSHTPEPPSPNYTFMLVNVSDQAAIESIIERIEGFTFTRFPDLETTLRRIENGPPINTPVEVRISGRETDEIFAIVDRVKAHLSAVAGAKNVSDNWGSRTKKLFVEVSQPRARRAGVTSQDVAVSLQTGLSGIELTEYREDDKLIPITLRSQGADRRDVDKLESFAVFAQATGRSVPLKQVADVRVEWQPAKILRRDRLQTVTVGSQLEPGYTATQINREIQPWLEEESRTWPLGYRWEFGGEAETSGEANQSIAEKLPIAAMIIILLLVAQFDSIRRPLIILLTIPLGLIGVIFGLLLARSYFGFMTLLGIISLAGIVINNAIVLIDRIRIEIEENGHPPPMAIIEAAQRRLRPILLTTATTMGGLIPLWLGGGAMWEPMAIAIIFGLAFATTLTLGVVPVLYSLFFRVSFKGFRYVVS